MLDLKSLRSDLSHAVADKNLTKIHNIIIEFENLNLPANDWTKYLVQIFAMLTDPHIETPTFVRRAPVFRIFRLVTKMRLMENNDVGNLRKILEFLLRIVQVMSSAVISRRQIDLEMKKSFHSYLQKLILFAMDSEHLKYSLPQDKIKILEKVYPVPNSSEKSTQFICSDLILWYELFLQIKNTVQFDFTQQKLAVEYLTRISVSMKMTKEPVVRWVFIYNMVQEALKIYNIYEENLDVENMCGKIGVLALTQIREYFSPFLQVQKINDHNQNIFVTAVRFNILSLCLTLLQNAKNNQSWVKNIISEIKKVADILIDRVKYEKSRVTSGDNTNAKLFKFQLQLEWISCYIRFRQKILRSSQNQEKDSKEIYEISYLSADSQLFNKLCQESDLIVNYSKLQKFEDILQDIMENYRKRTNTKVSQIPHMPQFLLWSVGLLSEKIGDFFKTIKKICSSLEQLKLLTCLLTQFHISNRTLILNTFQICLKVLNEYFMAPETIKLDEDVENIRLAILPLILCQKQGKIYKCTYCGVFQMSLFCPHCDQACGQFIRSSKMPNLTCKWQQFIKMWQYFSGNELNRLNQHLSRHLIQSVNLFQSY